jgi:hypothetical protein
MPRHCPKVVGYRSFGTSLAVVGDYIAVSAILDSSAATNSGVVHIYDGTTRQFVRTIANPDPKAEDRFGIDMTAFGNLLLVGSTGAQNGPGAAYLVDPLTGVIARTLQNPTPAPGDEVWACRCRRRRRCPNRGSMG